MSDENDRPFDGMPDLSGLPDRPGRLDRIEPDVKPWEQRIGPGMGGMGGSSAMPEEEKVDSHSRICEELTGDGLAEVVDRQTDLVHLVMVDLQTTPDTDLVVKATSNEQVWQLFLDEHLYDTRRVTLEHVHLFEWFPVAPGRFHTAEAHSQRRMAYQMLERLPGGDVYFNPAGKAAMVRGGVGAVRLRPRQVAGEPHYFMTASSSGVCHEGFPVLVPRRFYGRLKARILREGAVPVTLGGEMRYVPESAVTFFGQSREAPLLYLHVDELQVLAAPRSRVTSYLVSVAVAFVGRFEGREGAYVTYVSFDPARSAEFRSAVQWLESVYVKGQHRGVIVTDFDEAQARFPDAVFGLPDLMAGKLGQDRIKAWLRDGGLDERAGQPFYLVYREINTHGGAYIEGDVHVHGGDFVGRDLHR